MNIGGMTVGGAAPCRFVFEVSNAHNGSFARAHRLVDGAKNAGADFFKVQAYTPAELVALRGDGPAPEPWGAQGWTMAALYEKARTPLDWLPELFTHAREAGLIPFASVFGSESLAACEAIACPAYKMARLDNAQRWLADAMNDTGKPTLISAATEDETEAVADGWLWCPPGYPATVRGMPVFGDTEGFQWIGLSSHCLAPAVPIAAVARGCKLIEMHGMLDDEPSALESNVSLTVTQYRTMVDAVRRTEEMLG